MKFKPWMKVTAVILPTTVAVLGFIFTQNDRLTTACADTKHNAISINRVEQEASADIDKVEERVDAVDKRVGNIEKSVYRIEYIVGEIGRKQGVLIPAHTED